MVKGDFQKYLKWVQRKGELTWKYSVPICTLRLKLLRRKKNSSLSFTKLIRLAVWNKEGWNDVSHHYCLCSVLKNGPSLKGNGKPGSPHSLPSPSPEPSAVVRQTPAAEPLLVGADSLSGLLASCCGEWKDNKVLWDKALCLDNFHRPPGTYALKSLARHRRFFTFCPAPVFLPLLIGTLVQGTLENASRSEGLRVHKYILQSFASLPLALWPLDLGALPASGIPSPVPSPTWNVLYYLHCEAFPQGAGKVGCSHNISVFPFNIILPHCFTTMCPHDFLL